MVSSYLFRPHYCSLDVQTTLFELLQLLMSWTWREEVVEAIIISNMTAFHENTRKPEPLLVRNAGKKDTFALRLPFPVNALVKVCITQKEHLMRLQFYGLG